MKSKGGEMKSIDKHWNRVERQRHRAERMRNGTELNGS